MATYNTEVSEMYKLPICNFIGWTHIPELAAQAGASHYSHVLFNTLVTRSISVLLLLE